MAILTLQGYCATVDLAKRTDATHIATATPAEVAAVVGAANTLTMGVAGSSVGTIIFKNATSGQITLTPPTGALGTRVLTFPASTGTFALTTDTAPSSALITIVDDTSTNATMYPTWVTTTTGNLPLKVSSTKITFNPSTANLTTTTFTGALAGNATTATSATSATTATNATNSAITNDTTTNATMYPVWVTTTTGNLPLKVSSTKLSFNPSSGAVSVGGNITSLTGATFGAGGGTTGFLNMYGTTSGNALTLTVGASTAEYTFTLPSSAGTNKYLLQTNGSGVTSFVQADLTAAVTGVLPPANGGTGVANSKNLTVSNSLTLAGIDSTVMTFPSTSATIARTDAANTFTGASTASAWVLTSPTITTKISPTSDDGAPLGDTTHHFSDLFLATGAVINFQNGNVAVTHSSGILTMGTGEFRITTPGTNSASVPTLGSTSTMTNKTFTAPVLDTGTVTTSLVPTSNDGAALGNTSNQFSDLFLAEGGVINWDNGDATITQTGNDITVAGITTFGMGTSTALTVGTIELGHATQNTLSASGGVLSVEGVAVPSISSTSTITNKRNQPRITSAASYTTDTGTSLDVSTTDIFVITAQAGALKFNNPSGTPVAGEKFVIRVKDNGSPRALTYDTQYRASSDLALPTTTVTSKTLYMLFIWNATDSKADLLAVLNNF